MEIKNSSGKVIGQIEMTDTQIKINNYKKPELVIEDKAIINMILNKDETAIETLFNDYYLLVGEIAALYNVCYATMAKHLRARGIDTNSRAGRRNSSYGTTFSEERIQNICKALEGKRRWGVYERTPEMRDKISQSLKAYYSTHEVSQETREKLSQAWKNGKYDNAKMGRGYNGYFFSIKNQRDFYFRSFLELSYLLKLEKDEKVENYIVEPFQIKLPNNHHYTPDILVNNELLIELKPKAHLNWEDEKRWQMELEGADQFCKEHNYKFKIIYDEDIYFESRTFKRWFLTHQSELEPYNIRLQKDVIWS